MRRSKMRKLSITLSCLVVLSLLLAACAPQAPTATEPAVGPTLAEPTAEQPTEEPTAEPTEPPAPTEPPTTRRGGWLDEIVFSVVSSDSAVTQIEAGAIDIYAGGLASAEFPTITAAGLNYSTSNGLYYDQLYNPAVCAD